MSYLLIEPLSTEDLVQSVRLNRSERYQIGSFIPYIYLHNAPSGIFTLSVEKDSIVLFQKSFTSLDIQSAMNTTDDYIHCFYPVVPNNPIQLESGIFDVRLSATSYTNISSSFIGWIRQFEDLNNTLDYTPIADNHKPLAIRLKIYDRGIK